MKNPTKRLIIDLTGKLQCFPLATDQLYRTEIDMDLCKRCLTITVYSQKLPKKETASKLLKNEKAKPISKAEMNKIKEARKKDRAATPDYELGYGTGPGGSINLAARKAARTSRLAGRVSKRRR